MVTVTKYASTVEEFTDDRLQQTTQWSDLWNACSSNNLSAYATYRKGYIPTQLYCHDFDFDLPSKIVVQNIKFEVKIKGDDIDAVVPTAFFYWHTGLGHLTDGNFYGGEVYSDVSFQKVSSQFNVVEYNMDRFNIEQYGMPSDRVNWDNFGTILLFGENIKNTEGNVYVEWVRCTVEYDVAEYSLEVRGNISPNEYDAVNRNYNVGNTFTLTFFCHKFNYVESDPVTVDLDVPLGLALVEFTTSEGASFDPNTFKATYSYNITSSPYVKLKLRAKTTGTKKIGMVLGETTTYGYLYVNKPSASMIESDDRLSITSGDIRKWSESCFHFAVKAYSTTGTVGYSVWLDSTDLTDTNELVGWKFDDVESSDGVTYNYSTSNYIEFDVPKNETVTILFTGCFLPKSVGNKTLICTSDDSLNEYTYDYVVLEPYTYIFNLLNHDILFNYARLVSQVETGAYVYPTGVSEYDDDLIVDPCSLMMEKIEDIDYIGCVALKQTHYDPKSTYKDTLLNTSYKNKRYMGKKGASDETIDLNVRLPPRDVTTIQGLIDMDKPVPVNTNHLAFEGDSLNHRGWVELYGITTEPVGNNPHWYNCDISVKYITHNLNSRFLINKGSRVSDYFLPELLVDKHDYGDDLKDSFLVECSGAYTYSPSQIDFHKRNFFGLPNQKKLVLRGLEKLSVKSEVALNWYTSRNVENVHNKISHIIRLVDAETGNAVLEYEYYDIDFTHTGKYNCRVICRVLYKGAYKTVLNRNFILHSDAEFDSSQAGEIDVYGSEIIFRVVNDKVTIQDSGFSGKELFIEDIDIQDGQYYFDVEFKNNNVENDAPDILNYLDVSIKELDLSSKYSNYYGNVLVSPFPVPNKKVVYTRQSEDGTIYYLEDDGTECSYMLNPYYSYKCGVDLQSRDGISIFNIDNNYKVVYITNGLVKLGINRYNGKVTLYKYDKHSKEYILTNHLQLTKYEDINLNSYSDDKVELQASDSIFTMWRGRPYVHIAHETEDILLADKWVKIYAEGVGDDISETPQTWNLIDTTNLLPSKMASNKGISVDVWDLTDDSSTLINGTATVSLTTNGGTANDSVFTSTHTLSSQTELVFLVDGVITEKTDDNELTYQFEDAGTHTVQAIYYADDSYAKSNILEVTIQDNSYRITPTFPSSMYYLQNDFTCLLTYAGDPVSGETVVFYVNGLSYPKVTNENGIATLNNRLAPREQLIDPNLETGDVEENQSQDDKYVAQSIPYNVVMTYSDNGVVLAKAEKEALVLKGNVTVTPSSTTITQNNPITFTFTNGLDPSRDDIISGEQYVTGKVVVLTINGADYTRIINSSGQVQLMIRLPVGLYDLKVTFAGDNQYSGVVKRYEITVVGS